jgi:hypothetical protein
MSIANDRPCVHPEPRNPAVHRCCQARNRVLADCKGLQLADWRAEILGAEAFLTAMPDIATIQDIRDYAACINHAVALRVIEPSQAPPLLASARIVLASYRADQPARNSEPEKKSPGTQQAPSQSAV